MNTVKYLMIFVINFSLLTCKVHTPNAVNKFEYSREELKRRTFHYFWETAHKKNFQIPDRYPTLTFSSIAATGFGLSSYIVGIENKYINRNEGAERTLKTLEILWSLPTGAQSNKVSSYKGFFYHFLTLDEAHRYKNVELSSIDTGLLMAGILSAQSYFDGDNETEKKIRMLTDSLYRRVDWQWMMNGKKTMSMGWHPESGFIESQWIGYNEAMILLILALGSPTHSIDADAWQYWCNGYEWGTFYGEDFIQFDPLFGHQYSHIWIDFRNIHDTYTATKNIDYFENSKRASIANKKYCIANPKNFKGYHENLWGLTACDGPHSGEKIIKGRKYDFYDYRARGAALTNIVDDGTIAPTAAGGSIAFIPEEAENAMKYMWNTYYEDLVGQYGFKDAFNLTYQDEKHPNGWFDIDYLGIDQGPILLQMANLENETIWKIMKKNPYIREGLKKAGFR